MKKTKLLHGFALALLMALGIAGTAHATDYTGSCANYPNLPGGGTFDGNGNVNITDQNCTLSQSVTATGVIVIDASGGSITSPGKNLNAGGGVSLTGNSVVIGNVDGAGGDVFLISNLGIITAGTVTSDSGKVIISGDDTVTTSDITATGTSVYVSSTNGNVSTGRIIGHGDSIQVLANSGKITVSDSVIGSDLTQIFAAKDTISLKDVTNSDGDVRIFANQAGGSSPFTIGSTGSNAVLSIHNDGASFRSIYVSNGGTGGISYSGTSNLSVKNSAGPTGNIILDGQGSGNVTLTGSFDVDGSGQQAGAINIFAPQVIANGATLSASSPGNAVGVINLVTNQITTTGALTLNVNGNGPFAQFVELSLFPVDSYSVQAPLDPNQFITFGPFQPSANPLTISGAGALTINANGDNNGLKILGYPLQLKSASTTINNKGSGNGVFIQSTDGANLRGVLTLNGTIAVHSNSTGPVQVPNQIGVDGTSIPSLTGNVLLDAAGTNGGDGGQIYLTSDSGTINFGSSGNNFALNANGSSTGGKGGTITVGGGTTSYVVKAANGLTASVQGGNGDGGTITLTGQNLSNTSGSTSTIAADGKGTGNGGKISVVSSGNITASSATTAFSFEAKAGTTGNGGEIDLTGNIISLDGTKISVSAQGNGKGGILNINANTQLKLTAGSLDASGAGSKDGGKITLNGPTLTVSGSAYSIKADAGSSQGKGGTVDITSSGAVKVGTGTGAVTISAVGKGTGGGGNISVVGQPVTVAGASILVSPGATSGSAGVINLNSNGTGASGILTTSGTFNASGIGSGAGGTIVLQGDTLSMGTSQLLANGGATGPGGQISVTSASSSTTFTTTSAVIKALGGSTSGKGGSVFVTSGAGITIPAATTIDTSASSVNAGPINISSPSTAAGHIFTIAGTVRAVGSNTALGGAISLSNESQNNTTAINITGTIDASGAIGGGSATFLFNNFNSAPEGLIVSSSGTLKADGLNGRITFNTDTFLDVLVVLNNGTLSANNGTVELTNANNNVIFTAVKVTGTLSATGKNVKVNMTGTASNTVTVKNLTATVGDVIFLDPNNKTSLTTKDSGLATAAISASGQVNITANSVSISDGAAPTKDFVSGSTVTIATPSGSNGSIIIGSNIQTSGTAALTAHGTGSIQTNTTAQVIANSLVMQAENGSINNVSSSSSLTTKVGSLSAITSKPGSGVVKISNTDTGGGLTIGAVATSGGSFTVTSNAAIAMSGIAAGGAISVTSGSGALSISPDASITTDLGNISLLSSGTILVGARDVITAAGSLSLSIAGAPVNVCSDNGAQPGPTCRPLTATVTVATGGSLFWPASNADITGGFFTATAENSKTLSFNAATAGSIVLNGGAALKAN